MRFFLFQDDGNAAKIHMRLPNTYVKVALNIIPLRRCIRRVNTKIYNERKTVLSGWHFSGKTSTAWNED